MRRALGPLATLASRLGRPRPVIAALLGALLALVAFAAFALAYLSPSTPGPQVRLDQLDALTAAGRIQSATLLDHDSRISLRLKTGAEVPGVKVTEHRAWVDYPSRGEVTATIVTSLKSAGVPVRVDQQGGKDTVDTILKFLVPVLVLATLFALLFLSKSGGSAIDDIVSFSGVGETRGESRLTFTSVGGADEAVTELAEVVDYLKNPSRYETLGATPPKGVMLFGPPGTGKTLLAKATAGEAGVPFFSVAGAQFVESLVGVGAARVRDLFAKVREVAPAIVFIDEIDAAGRRRQAGGGSGGTDEREQTLNQLLVEMDGFAVSTGVVVIAATNRPDILDPALLRPGRFDRHITVERPDQAGRERILRIHAGSKPLAPDVDLARTAARTPGFTGADLASVVNEAALLTIRRGGQTLTGADIAEAVARVLSGPQRRGHLMSPEERFRAATHESGHAIVATALGRADDLHRVTILGRGRQLAATALAERDATLLSHAELSAQIVTTLAGVAAERVVIGDTSTAGEDDLQHATDIARDMVGRYGMSKAVGPVRLLAAAGGAFLGEETPLADLSPAAKQLLENEVRTLVERGLAEAQAVLTRHRRHLDTLTEDLLEHETLEDDDLHAALSSLVGALTRPRTAKPAPAKALPRSTPKRPAAKAVPVKRAGRP